MRIISIREVSVFYAVVQDDTGQELELEISSEGFEALRALMQRQPSPEEQQRQSNAAASFFEELTGAGLEIPDRQQLKDRSQPPQPLGEMPEDLRAKLSMVGVDADPDPGEVFQDASQDEGGEQIG